MPQVQYALDAAIEKDIVLGRSAQFRVATMHEGKCSLTSYNRRDFFKISFITEGRSHLFYANRDFKIEGPALVFTSPAVPFSWEVNDIAAISGYFCVFTDSFLQTPGSRESLQNSPVFMAGGNPVFSLNCEQINYIESLFQRIQLEIDSDYKHKFEVIASHVNLLIHEAMKMQPAEPFQTPVNASTRITKLFLDLLERQFPIDFPDHMLQSKKASDFARLLNVHPNHLNAAVQETTGKSTTTHINERVLREAKSLIVHTDWSIAEVAFGLGFDYVSYFNRFFKKHEDCTPIAYRKTH